jgi:L-ascorbate metabolism protein UlaG (beta-lactamase superfamily)
MLKRIKRIMIIAVSILFLFGVGVYAFMQHSKFGKKPEGERLEILKKSPNYKNGAFQNISDTPIMTGTSYTKLFKEFFFSKNKTPLDSIPSTKTDLLNLTSDKDILVWFGHSSYFIQIDGKKILVDPVLSGNASPISFTTKAFKGTDVYATDDIPEIDYLFITHDHWDHLDYRAIIKLKPKIKKVICGLGVGEHLEYWGFDTSQIIEKDWNDRVRLDSGFVVNITPARHFSGRNFQRNKSLWVSFVLQTPTSQIFLGGDGGYDKHFAEIGKAFGVFDLVILENGQYNESWKFIHMLPDEVLQAAKDLNAKRLLPVHSAKFALANHAWNEPLKKIAELHKDSAISLLTPIIGEQVNLKDSTQVFRHWWEGIN